MFRYKGYMHPICFHVGPWAIYWYGVMVAMAFLLAVTHWNFLARRQGRVAGFGSELAIWLIVGGVIGARAAYVFANWSEYAAYPISIFFIRQGGLVFYGGWIGGAAALLLFARVRREPLWPLADFTISAIPLAHAVGRIGCFLNGCCYGKPTDAPWGVFLEGAVRHPTQLYEFAVNLLIYGLMWIALARKPRPGVLLALYLCTYPAARFAIEFFRGDPRIRHGDLSLAQWVSLALFLCGLALWIGALRRSPSAHSEFRHSA